MRAWFYPGDNFGQEFMYPKHLRQLASLTVVQARTVEPPPPAVVPEAKVIEPEPAVAVVREPEPAPEAVVEERKEEVIIAQNNPPPAPAAEPAPAPPPAASSAPEELPKTATPYPIIGLGGLFSLSLYGLLRLKRSA
jgi:hypothetical protein